ncbi:MAG TPA: hypothetical protein VN228_12375 [Pyrinomonadaceae bacterium]|nr:hypothetical protein [Pyrinomonadaceae bacterium]
MKKALVAALLCASALSFAPARAGGETRGARAGARRKGAVASRVPRVGTIKDYPATGMMVGCGNSYFVPAGQVERAGENYVFLARHGGDGAWMNLDGRDTRLTLLRASGARTEYRAGATRISVRAEPTGDDTYSVKLTIVLRRGRARRVVRAVGYADC